MSMRLISYSRLITPLKNQKREIMSGGALRCSQNEAERTVTRLRNTMPDRFYSICKMHLSFLLDMDSESLEELLMPDLREFKKKNFTPFTKKKIVDKPLPRCYLSQDSVAQIYQLIEYLGHKSNITCEGLFRKTGNIARQKLLREQLSSCGRIDLSDGLYSPHDVANVLKGYLADLSEPLLTERHFHAHCQIADLSQSDILEGNKKQIAAFQLLILLLPRENSVVLECLLDLLHNVTKVEENMMTSMSLGTVFAPHLLCPRKLPASELQTVSRATASIVAFMIDNAAELFKIPKDFAVDVANFWKQMEDPNRIIDHNMTDYSLYMSTFSNKKQKRDSVRSDDDEINTVVSFTDRELSKQADTEMDTQVALAELYANVQRMPESARKRKMLKQFNRANGMGSPALNKHHRSKSLGDALKKRFAGGSGKHKRQNSGHHTQLANTYSWNVLQVSDPEPMERQKSPVVHIVDVATYNRANRKRMCSEAIDDLCCVPLKASPTPEGDSPCSENEINYICAKTRAANAMLPPHTPERFMLKPVALVSPITKSVKKASKCVQEAAMTPRSRAPLALVLSPQESDL